VAARCKTGFDDFAAVFDEGPTMLLTTLAPLNSFVSASTLCSTPTTS